MDGQELTSLLHFCWMLTKFLLWLMDWDNILALQ